MAEYISVNGHWVEVEEHKHKTASIVKKETVFEVPVVEVPVEIKKSCKT